MCAALAAAATARAQILDLNLPGTDGTVHSVARAGNTLYLVGEFSVAGPCTGGGVPLDLHSGVPWRRFPRFCGTVNAIAPDGHGGWFVGGLFDHVEGEARANLAHVTADGTLSRWSASVPGGRVSTLVLDGSTLYVGGVFSSVNGSPRGGIAAIDASTGALLPWDPGTNGSVRYLLLRDRRLYVGGAFSQVGDSARANLAAFDLRTGALTEWAPNTDGAVFALAAGGPTIYVAGEFDHVGGMYRNSVAAVDAETGAVTPWDPGLQPRRTYVANGEWIWPFAEGLAVIGHTVYVGGKFDGAGGVARRGIVALDTRTAQVTAFDARLEGEHPNWIVYVNAIEAQGQRLYVGGMFSEAGRQPRLNLAELDTRTGRATGWNPRAAGRTGESYGRFRFRWLKLEGAVGRIAIAGDQMFVGGGMTHLYDWLPRNRVAAIDLPTGRVLPWAPVVDGYRTTGVGVIGTTTYLSGDFSQVNGVPRRNAAAVDTGTAELRPWRLALKLETPSLYTSIATLAVDDRTVYLSGYIYGLSNLNVNNVAAVDPVSGDPTQWNPYCNGGAYAILPTDHAIYVGGGFSELGGTQCNLLGAVDPIIGNALPWNPSPGGPFYPGPVVFALAEGAGTIYVGGRTATMHGSPHANAAAVDSVLGSVRPWDPEPDDYVEALAVDGADVWVGGHFQSVGGATRPFLAVVDTANGVAREWVADANSDVLSLLADQGTVIVGGSFTELRGYPCGGLALLGTAAPSDRKREPLAYAAAGATPRLAWTLPSPLSGNGAIRLSLATPASVSIEVLDPQGRRVATLAGGELQSAGVHAFAVPAAAWPAGIYFCRLRAGTSATTRKLVVTH